MQSIVREADGAVYHVTFMASEGSMWQPVYHYRAAYCGTWLPLRAARTLPEANAVIQQATLEPPWEPPAEPEFFYRS